MLKHPGAVILNVITFNSACLASQITGPNL